MQPFERFISNLGGVSTELTGTPLPVYELKGTYLHYIPLEAAAQFSTDFTHRLSVQYFDSPVRIIHIWEDVWNTKERIVASRIRAIAGLGKKIHARTTQVSRLDKQTSDDFLKVHHLQGTTQAYYKFGLMQKQQLVAVATFSKARTMYDGPVYYRSYELERFACTNGYTVTGGLGKLLHAFTDLVNPAHTMTYADADWGKGEGYQKLGFTPAGFSAPHVFYVHPATCVRHAESQLLIQATERELLDQGYIKVFTAGNVKYILDRRV
ncbi:MAG: hypothetical protein ACK45I_06590 [Bacteroidota bacterium]